MTKEQANKIKKIVKKECGDFTVYFNSKKGELRYTAAQWYDDSGSDHDALFNKNVKKIFDALTKNGVPVPNHKEAYRRYQGFINCLYIVFE